jgi:hypothetical protein
MTRAFDAPAAFVTDRARWALAGEVRVLFEGAFMTFPMPRNSTLADLAEKLRSLERHGEPRHIELLLSQGRRAAQPQSSATL